MDRDLPDLSSAVAALGALAQTHRLALFRELVQAGNGGVPAGALAKRLEIPPSSLSFHLSALKKGGLVEERREGRSIIYTADYTAMHALVAFLLHNCCAGDAVAPELITQFAKGDPS
ncbi:MAG: metalloregulator ArsR/SmtB family transcription factor [Pseudomonadota bacterium]